MVQWPVLTELRRTDTGERVRYLPVRDVHFLIEDRAGVRAPSEGARGLLDHVRERLARAQVLELDVVRLSLVSNVCVRWGLTHPRLYQTIANCNSSYSD